MVVAAGLLYLARRSEIEAREKAVALAWKQVEAAIKEHSSSVPPLLSLLEKENRLTPVVRDRILSALEGVLRARTPREIIVANQQLDGSLAAIRSLPVAPGSPPRASPAQSLRVLDHLAVVENQVAVERSRYNERLQEYNVSIQLFPDNLVAALAGFRKQEAYMPEGAR